MKLIRNTERQLVITSTGCTIPRTRVLVPEFTEKVRRPTQASKGPESLTLADFQPSGKCEYFVQGEAFHENNQQR